jgi:hypothetical protein
LHSAIGYVTPADPLAGLAGVIFAQRDRKLETPRAARRQQRKTKCGQPTLPGAEEKNREGLSGVSGAGNEAPWSPEPMTLTA